MFNLYELNQLTIAPIQKPEKKTKLVGACAKRRESTWSRFHQQQDEIQKALKKSSVWKVAIKFGFCHKTLQKYLNEAASESKSQVN